MNEKLSQEALQKILEQSILDIIGGENGLRKETNMLIEKHKQKVHFIPIKYRVLGGFLQSLNIKFGNFIEILIPKLIMLIETDIEVIKEYSGTKNVKLSLEQKCEREIDDYINHPPKKINNEIITKLLDNIFTLQNNEKGKLKAETFDIDLLIKKNKKYYYIETKYNDDHDTGKFKDINRKFLKTYAGLVHELGIKNRDNFSPIIYYFNENIRYKDVYFKEGINVFRGRQLFEELQFSVKFSDIEGILLKISENLENKFDEFKDKIFKMVKNHE